MDITMSIRAISMVRKIQLKSEDIRKLFTDKYLLMSDDVLIQMQKDCLQLNNNGKIYDSVSIKIDFEKQEYCYEFAAKHLQELLCKHLNLFPNEVIFINCDGEEFEFEIRFHPNTKSHIVVCEFQRAVDNTAALSDNPFPADISYDYIGLYKKLGQSPYYFRWI